MDTDMARPGMRARLRTWHVIAGLGVWMAVSTSGVAAIAFASGKPVFRAVICMALGVVILWIGCAGGLMRAGRNKIRAAFQSVRLPWRWKFVLFATALAMTEEAITTSMTNLAPAFGVPIGAAYITASTNYLDVICLHSVVVFVPMFVAWAWLLGRYSFHPNAVFLLFGLTGTLAEMSFSGPQALAEIGFWTFVYGLMVYLPAYCVPEDRAAARPPGWSFPLAVVLPFFFAIPVAGPVGFLHPVKVHFPPMNPNG